MTDKTDEGVSLLVDACILVRDLEPDRMKTLILDVLNYSKLSAIENAFSIFDLNDVVKELLDDFEMVISDKNAANYVSELPDMEGNRRQIRQVFQNILWNALKFSKTDIRPEIVISRKRFKRKSNDSEAQENGPYCLILIEDNGIGFDEQYFSKIFILFERLHSKKAYEETGIGLAITNRIIENHNGLVTAKGNPGDGAEFILVLPIRQESIM